MINLPLLTAQRPLEPDYTIAIRQEQATHNPGGGEGEIRYERMWLVREYEDQIRDALALYKP